MACASGPKKQEEVRRRTDRQAMMERHRQPHSPTGRPAPRGDRKRGRNQFDPQKLWGHVGPRCTAATPRCSLCEEKHVAADHRFSLEGHQAKRGHLFPHGVAKCRDCRGSHLSQTRVCPARKLAQLRPRGGGRRPSHVGSEGLRARRLPRTRPRVPRPRTARARWRSRRMNLSQLRRRWRSRGTSVSDETVLFPLSSFPVCLVFLLFALFCWWFGGRREGRIEHVDLGRRDMVICILHAQRPTAVTKVAAPRPTTRRKTFGRITTNCIG